MAFSSYGDQFCFGQCYSKWNEGSDRSEGKSLESPDFLFQHIDDPDLPDAYLIYYLFDN